MLSTVEPALQQGNLETAFPTKQIIYLAGTRSITIRRSKSMFKYDQRSAPLDRCNCALKYLELSPFDVNLDQVNVITFGDHIIQAIGANRNRAIRFIRTIICPLAKTAVARI